MLDDLEQNVDHSDAKLSSAMSRMKKFIHQTEGPFLFSVLLRVCSHFPFPLLTRPNLILDRKNHRNKIRMVYHHPRNHPNVSTPPRHSHIATATLPSTSPVLIRPVNSSILAPRRHAPESTPLTSPYLPSGVIQTPRHDTFFVGLVFMFFRRYPPHSFTPSLPISMSLLRSLIHSIRLPTFVRHSSLAVSALWDND